MLLFPTLGLQEFVIGEFWKMEFIGKNATVHMMAVMDLAQLRKYLILFHEKCLSTYSKTLR